MLGLATKALLLLALIGPSWTYIASDGSKRCKHFKARRMLQVQCYDLKLIDIPANLQPGIEVLDARENRLGRLANGSLGRYPELRELYLQSCGMALIEPAALEPSQRLEVLDLSANLLRELPAGLFRLPALRKLYLHDNRLEPGALDFTDDQPALSPLEVLDLSATGLERMPRLGSMPELVALNLSRNVIRSVGVDDLARLCSLREFNISGNELSFDEANCGCFELRRWIHLRGIRLNAPLDCPAAQSERCSDVVFTNRTLELYEDCLLSRQRRAETRRAVSTKVWIAVCLGLLLVAAVLLGTFLLYRRTKAAKSLRCFRRELVKQQGA